MWVWEPLRCDVVVVIIEKRFVTGVIAGMFY